ncbi:unnamed protein product [Dimorphilus gyrociliatus]|uniref:Uncharacterized protein n=1 Tax=Dimorphilus gyrociliatus TaxID=2664684 RepID=A0A7I8WDT4_9ANNE|nr:unnamed protein product [Dimorphilus gyrociliatus]
MEKTNVMLILSLYVFIDFHFSQSENFMIVNLAQPFFGIECQASSEISEDRSCKKLFDGSTQNDNFWLPNNADTEKSWINFSWVVKSRVISINSYTTQTSYNSAKMIFPDGQEETTQLFTLPFVWRRFILTNQIVTKSLKIEFSNRAGISGEGELTIYGKVYYFVDWDRHPNVMEDGCEILYYHTNLLEATDVAHFQRGTSCSSSSTYSNERHCQFALNHLVQLPGGEVNGREWISNGNSVVNCWLRIDFQHLYRISFLKITQRQTPALLVKNIDLEFLDGTFSHDLLNNILEQTFQLDKIYYSNYLKLYPKTLHSYSGHIGFSGIEAHSLIPGVNGLKSLSKNSCHSTSKTIAFDKNPNTCTPINSADIKFLAKFNSLAKINITIKESSEEMCKNLNLIHQIVDDKYEECKLESFLSSCEFTCLKCLYDSICKFILYQHTSEICEILLE